MKLSILHKGLLIVSIPLLFEVFFVFVLVHQIDHTSSQIKMELRSHDVIIAVETILKEIADATTTAVIFNVTRRDDLLKRMEKSHRNINRNVAKLRRLTKSDEAERVAASRIAASARDWMKNHNRVVKLDPQNKIGAFFALKGNIGNLLVMRSEGSNKLIIEKEKRIQTVQPKLLRESIYRIQILLVFGAIVNITITIFLAIYFAKYVTQRLDNVIINTYKLGARVELNPPMRGEDEIAELDQALHYSASEVMQFETFKEQLIGVVSHELRTPLTSIQGTLTLLQAGAMGDYPESILDSVGETQNNLTKLINLVNDLLLLERLESGSQVLKEEEIDLQSLINQAYESVQQEYSNAKQKLSLTSKEETCTTVGDTMLLEKAFFIILLISQCRQNGEKQSTARITPTAEAISIEVEDSGGVITDEKQTQYFTKNFFPEELERVSSLDILSRAICKAIVTAHSGRLEIDSSEKSTKFKVILPYRRIQSD